MAPDGAPLHYERHRPEQITLYRLVQQHAALYCAHSPGPCRGRLELQFRARNERHEFGDGEHGHRTRVVEQVLDLVTAEDRIDCGRDRADLLRRGNGRYELEGVRQVERDAVAGLEPLRAYRVRQARRIGVELSIGDRAAFEKDAGSDGARTAHCCRLVARSIGAPQRKEARVRCTSMPPGTRLSAAIRWLFTPGAIQPSTPPTPMREPRTQGRLSRRSALLAIAGTGVFSARSGVG